MKKILLTTDFSKNALNAIEYAIQLFGTEDIAYYLLNTYMEPRSSANVVVSIKDFLEKESAKGLARVTELLRDKFNADDLSLVELSHYGNLTAVISKMTKVEEFDYVVIGTKGASGLENFLMGSNTLDVVKSVKQPVLVIPTGKKFEPLDRIALAADYEHIDHIHLLDSLINIVRLHKAKLKIVNIITENSPTDYQHAIEGFELHNILEDITHEFYSEKNEHVVDGIEHFMKEKDVQLLSMVARKHTFFDRVFNKSVTKQISKLSDIPLLIIHE